MTLGPCSSVPAQWRAPLLCLSPVQSPVTLKTDLRASCRDVQENLGLSSKVPVLQELEASVSPASYKHPPVFVQVFVHGCHVEPSHFEEEVVDNFFWWRTEEVLWEEERERKN